MGYSRSKAATLTKAEWQNTRALRVQDEVEALMAAFDAIGKELRARGKLPNGSSITRVSRRTWPTSARTSSSRWRGPCGIADRK